MYRIDSTQTHPLYRVAATRAIEQAAAVGLPPHTLMARAGWAVACLARALAPHARRIWIACGSGNNGGDGLVAATHLHQWAQTQAGGPEVLVTHTLQHGPQTAPAPPDARWALAAAQQAGVRFVEQPPTQFDLAIDALLGIGARASPQGVLAQWLALLRHSSAPLLCVDLPSALDADTGVLAGWPHTTGERAPSGPRHTLALLTLKPGLFTADGRDAAGQVWFDPLQTAAAQLPPPCAWLAGRTDGGADRTGRLHISHKGSQGDVLVLGGQDMRVDGAGMTGAALLAARAALHAGAGRVFVGLLGAPSDAPALHWDPINPELMLRTPAALLDSALLSSAALVCGCGGGASVAAVLARVLACAPRLVLDADALNAVAHERPLQTLLQQRGARGWITVLTPHAQEAARLLGSSAAAVMADRLLAAHTLAERYAALCVLKGSGTLIVAPGQTALINPSGNAALASAGTGDVLAGLIGGALAPLGGATMAQALPRVAQAVFQHGWLADQWGVGLPPLGTLSASRLAAQVRPLA